MMADINTDLFNLLLNALSVLLIGVASWFVRRVSEDVGAIDDRSRSNQVSIAELQEARKAAEVHRQEVRESIRELTGEVKQVRELISLEINRRRGQR